MKKREAEKRARAATTTTMTMTSDRGCPRGFSSVTLTPSKCNNIYIRAQLRGVGAQGTPWGRAERDASKGCIHPLPAIVPAGFLVTTGALFRRYRSRAATRTRRIDNRTPPVYRLIESGYSRYANVILLTRERLATIAAKFAS